MLNTHLLIRCLGLGSIGPHCTQALGDLGAEIIKIESKIGDDTRHWAPPSAPGDPTEAVYFLCTNRNKKSMVVDFKLKEGQDLIRELAKKSDVLVENYIPGTLNKYNLGYEQLKELNPKLIYVSLTGGLGDCLLGLISLLSKLTWLPFSQDTAKKVPMLFVLDTILLSREKLV